MLLPPGGILVSPFCLPEPQHVARPCCWSTVRTSIWGSRSWHQNQLYLHESRGWCTTCWRRHLCSLDRVRGQECAWVLPCKHLMFVFILTFTLWLNASPPNPVRALNSERGCSAMSKMDSGTAHCDVRHLSCHKRALQEYHRYGPRLWNTKAIQVKCSSGDYIPLSPS